MLDVGAHRGNTQTAAISSPTAFTIGSKVSIVGYVEFDGDIEIDGTVDGEVRCASVTISRYATVLGTIVAGSVTVAGGVSGAIYADRLVLKPASDVEGEIYYRELSLEDGSYFEGKSRPHQRPLELATPRETAVALPPPALAHS